MDARGMKRAITLAVGIGVGAACGGIGPAHATFISEGPIPGNPKVFLFLNKATDTTNFSANAGKHGTTGDLIWNAVASQSVNVDDGYADIKPTATHGVFDSITFTPVDDLIWGDFNFRGLAEGGTAATVTVTVNATGETTPFIFTFPVKNNGDFERVGAKSIDGETISSVTVSASEGFDEVKQISVSPCVPIAGTECKSVVIPTPEPASLILLGSGLVALGAARRRRT